MNQPEYPIILAIDPSLTSNGLAFPDQTTRVLKAGSLDGVDRLQSLRDQMSQLLTQGRPQLVVIEDYVLGQKRFTAGTISTGEWGGVLRLLLFDMGIPLAKVNPSTLKSYIGAKEKAGIISEIAAQTGRRFKTSDEADAWLLAAMAYDHFGHPWLKVTAAQRKALSRVTWPSLRRRPAA